MTNGGHTSKAKFEICPRYWHNLQIYHNLSMVPAMMAVASGLTVAITLAVSVPLVVSLALAVAITLAVSLALAVAITLAVPLALAVAITLAVPLAVARVLDMCAVIAETVVIRVRVISADVIAICPNVRTRIPEVIADIVTDYGDLLADGCKIVAYAVMVSIDIIPTSSCTCGKYACRFH